MFLRFLPPCILTLSLYAAGNHRPDDANSVITAGLVDLIEAPYSILDQRAAELLFPLAEQQHVSIIARTPLVSGALAGSWSEGMKFHRDDWRRRVFRGDLLRQTVQRVAEVKSLVESTAPLAQIALRFCLGHPAVSSVIPGVRSPEQVRWNLATSAQKPLPQQMQAQITRLWCEEFQLNVRTSIRTSIGEEGEG